MEKTDAVSIAIFIKRIILRMSFDSEKLQGQCYDDCATMMGKKKGVDTQIKNDISKKKIICCTIYPLPRTPACM